MRERLDYNEMMLLARVKGYRISDLDAQLIGYYYLGYGNADGYGYQIMLSAREVLRFINENVLDGSFGEPWRQGKYIFFDWYDA